jgi:3-hydroxybutyryl-CoA dehydrogenase
MDANSIGIVGTGQMATGIAQVTAQAGIRTIVRGRSTEKAEGSVAAIDKALSRAVEKGRASEEDKASTLGNLEATDDLQALASADLVIEAVAEDLGIKLDLFRQLDDICSDEAILTTTTSSLSVTELAMATGRPTRVLGLHFFNPAPVMKLIELVRTVVTDEQVVDTARTFAGTIGKSPVVVGDRRGFIANQLLFPYLNQAVWMVEGGYATKEDVDAAMRFGAGLPMGPLALTDLVGIDTFVGIMDAIHAQFQDSRFAPRPVLSQLAAAGFTGRKAGRGVYGYEEPGSSRVLPDDSTRPPADPSTIEGWQTVGVLGSGTMASGIVEVCAKAGFDVIVRGRSREKAEAVVAKVSKSMQRMVEKDRLSEEDMVSALQRITPTSELADLAPSDVVIEAVAEDLQVKREPAIAPLNLNEETP